MKKKKIQTEDANQSVQPQVLDLKILRQDDKIDIFRGGRTTQEVYAYGKKKYCMRACMDISSRWFF